MLKSTWPRPIITGNAKFADVALESYVLDVGKSLDAQQFSGDILRRETGHRDLDEPNRSDFRRRLRGVRLSAAQAGEAKSTDAGGTDEGEVSQKAASSLHERHVALL